MGMSEKEFGRYVTKLIGGDNLTRTEVTECFNEILLDRQSEMQQGAFLAALTAKGETAEEMAGVWSAIYELDTVKVKIDIDEPLVENCGTGMDRMNTFNISTAASIVAAADGIRMAKHGARAITSACGTVDILEELGVNVECTPDLVKKSIETAGIGIFNGMSPLIHPQALGRILSKISFGSVLNIAASLANPAAPTIAVRGVYCPDLLEPVAYTMRKIGMSRGLVVYGEGPDGKGIDEASTMGESLICEIKEDGSMTRYKITPEEFGINRCGVEDLAVMSEKHLEAKRFKALLEGNETQARIDIVCLNAGLTMYVAGKQPSIKDGYNRARILLLSGMAAKKLDDWVKAQQ